MSKGTTIRNSFDPFGNGQEDDVFPGILVATAPPMATGSDRYRLDGRHVFGRGLDCDIPVRDDSMSKKHFEITATGSEAFLRDLKSTNGTYCNGVRATDLVSLSDGAVIRAGDSIFVFHTEAQPFMNVSASVESAIIGRFHQGQVLEQLRHAARSSRHLLITGPSGVGKELASRELARVICDGIIIAHNAARFATEEEAATSIFGVGAKVFSGVESRLGLIEKAAGGMLFMDEVHNLPERLQKSLLRVIEENEFSRIGDTQGKPTDVRFVFATNITDPSRGLVHDLYARLREIEIPSLASRVADIPSIFNYVLKAQLEKHDIDADEVMKCLKGDHYEAICLDGFETDNVRGLIDLADRITTAIEHGGGPSSVIRELFRTRFADSPVLKRGGQPKEETTAASHYEKHKDAIISALVKTDGNLSAAERILKEQGIRCSRRWLREFAEKWGVR